MRKSLSGLLSILVFVFALDYAVAQTTPEPLREKWSQNIAEFCKVNSVGGMLKLNGNMKHIPPNYQEALAAVIPRIIQSPWMLAIVPNEKSREKALCQSLYDAYYGLGLHQSLQCENGRALPKELKELLANQVPANLAKNEEDLILSTLQAIPRQNEEFSLSSSSFVANALCAMTAVTSTQSCASSFLRMSEFMKPNNLDLAAIPLYQKILSDSSYIEGSARMGLKLIERYYETSHSAGTNLFSDLKNSFMEVGMIDVKAESMAWDIIGLISTGGANTLLRLKRIKLPSEFDRFKIAIALIASVSPVLDSRTIGSGRPYSMPANVQDTCDTGKPYHFWMSAYLSRQMTLKNKDPLGSAAAAFIVNKGYEMRARSGSRIPERAFYTPAFDEFNNIMRMDLALSSAGAIYGANAAQGKSTPQSIDEGLRVLIKSANDLSPLSKSDAEKMWKGLGSDGFHRWEKIFSPDSAFDFQAKYLQ